MATLHKVAPTGGQQLGQTAGRWVAESWVEFEEGIENGSRK
jgi:hypothetical protein